MSIKIREKNILLLFSVPIIHNFIVYMARLYFLECLIVHESIYLLDVSNLTGIAYCVITLILILWTLPKIIGNKIKLTLIFLSSSIVSNLIDRLVYGGVVDYFHVKKLGIINIADIGIVASLIILSTNFLLNGELYRKCIIKRQIH